MESGSVFKAAFRGIEIHTKSIQLEKLMIEEAQKLSMEASYITKNESESIKKIIRHFSPKKLISFQKDTLVFFKTLANSALLTKVIESMRISQETIEKHPLYSKQEREGLAYGLDLLETGLQLFQELKIEESKLILQGIQLIEEDWYARCLRV